jgi:DNA polymerase III alpha subunit
MTEYAELHAHSAFSFLDGASQPEDLAYEAARLGLRAVLAGGQAVLLALRDGVWHLEALYD